MEDTLRSLVALALGLLLILLRLDAEKFGAAEYDEATLSGSFPKLRRRLSWYVLGVAIVVAIYVVYPRPHDELHLQSGDRLRALVYGLGFAFVGALQALAFAELRYGRVRLPDPTTYPGAVLNALATALVDEAAFRGVLLGFLLVIGIDFGTANIVQALVYALATRVGAPGRDRYMLVLTLLIGLSGGWLVSATGGIGAAFIFHAVTRFSVFICTGHPGRVALPGLESEDVERVHQPPDGWRIVDPEGPSPRQ